jgi:glycine cleavage system H protein
MAQKFSADHVWVEPLGDGTAKVGISVHAQDALGDVVFIEFPALGARFAQGDVAGTVESVKAASDLVIPASGEVMECNTALRDDPSLANSAPLDAGWFFKVRLLNPSELDSLMDAAAYRSFSA